MPNFRFSQPNMSIVDEFSKIVGPDRVSVSSIDRANYSHDLWPMTSIWLQSDEFPYPPQMVIWPKSVAEIVRIIKLAVLRKVQVIPYGAGSGVCGGTLPVGGGMILDLKRMDKMLDLDEESMLVTVQPGMIGEIFERQLNKKGYTLGHFPSSMYCSTVGGWLATRSAGQFSSRYGKIEDMVVGLEVVVPSGEVLKTRVTPRSATGPDFKQLFIGSEGTLGVITKAILRIWPLPEHRIYQSFEFNHVP
jgi:alkyldihydroxyacetonephosphate synthase